MGLGEYARYQCSCNVYLAVRACPGVELGNVFSWCCYDCMRAYVSIFDLSGHEPEQVLLQVFDHIDHLPECLQFTWWWQNNEGEWVTAFDNWPMEHEMKVHHNRTLLCNDADYPS